jgi:hypothetical protein
MSVTSKWQQQGSYEYDYACCYISRSAWTGSTLPVCWNLNNLPSPIHAIGYPGTPTHGYPFNGKYQWDQKGNVYSTRYTQGGDGIFVMESWFTGGSSGGPWLGYPDDKRWVLGLQSGLYMDEKKQPIGQCISPYFGATFASLMDWAKKTWPSYAST